MDGTGDAVSCERGGNLHTVNIHTDAATKEKKQELLENPDNDLDSE